MLTSLGNDIVDLKTDEPPFNPRFTERVLTNQEREIIKDSKELLWLHWAAKEAAYKTLARSDPNLVFAHKNFGFDKNASVVFCENCELPCITEVTADYVAVVCATETDILTKPPLYHWISEKKETESDSQAIRELARAKIAHALHVSESAVEITPPQGRNIPPRVAIAGQESHLLSFAHHGRFIAIAFVPI